MVKDSRRSSGLTIGGTIALTLALGAIGYVGWLFGWHVYLIRTLFVGASSSGFWILMVLVVLIVSFILFGAFDRLALPIILVIATIAAFTWTGLASVHNTQKLYLADVEITNATELGNYDQRVPYEIAQNQADKNMGNSTGTAEASKSVAGDGNFGLWNTLIVQRGFAVGYESVISIDSPTFGNVTATDVQRCYFDDSAAKLRFGGALPHNDLARAVLSKVYFSKVSFRPSDSYSYCEGETPMVVMPLYKVTGFLFHKDIPWGVATYNGETGAITITQDKEKIEAIPGPTYPLSIAKFQREALQSSGGDWWAHVQGLLGWDTVGNTEVQLRIVDTKNSEYLTALQPRGASSNVVAVATVDANGFTPGKLNKLTVNVLEQERAANATVKDTITNEYSWMPEFSGNKYEVYEIVPGLDGGWVASIGTDQSVVYRVIIDSSGSKLQLIDRTGNQITRNGVIAGDGAVAVEFDGSIDSMTEAQLIQLIQQIAERLEALNVAPVE